MRKVKIYGVETANAMAYFSDFGKLDIRRVNGYDMDIRPTVKDKRVADYVARSEAWQENSARRDRLMQAVNAFRQEIDRQETRKKTVSKRGSISLCG